MLARKLKQWSKLRDAVTDKISEYERKKEALKIVGPGQAQVSLSQENEAEKASSQLQEQEAAKHDDLPKGFLFDTTLNLEALLMESKKHLQSPNPFLRHWAQSISEQFSLNPRLRSVLTDFRILEEHPFLIEAMTAQSFPSAQWSEGMVAVCMPYKPEVVFASPLLAAILFDEGAWAMQPVGGWEAHYRNLTTRCYDAICRDLLQIPMSFKLEPLIFERTEAATGLKRFYEFDWDEKYVKATAKAGEFKIGDRQKKTIQKSPEDLGQLVKILPPEQFEFRGATLMRVRDITESYCLDEIRNLLRYQDGLSEKASFEKISDLVRCYFRQSHLDLGLVVTQEERVIQVNSGDSLGSGELNAVKIEERAFSRSIYAEAQDASKIMCLSKEELSSRTGPFAQSLAESGYEGLLLVPLKFMDHFVGILELKSKDGAIIDRLDRHQVDELQVMFSEELDRENQSFRLSIQSVILEKYTAIHPSVEWAFRDAALDYVNQKLENEMAELAPIVFRNVFPLYGASDIRGSSSLRNKAIQADLKEQVSAAKAVIDTAIKENPMPKLQEIRFQMETQVQRLTEGLMAGDEITVLEFLNGEVETIFEAVKESIPGVESKIAAYKEQIHPDHGVFYKARKNYDNSVTLLNEAIAAYYDEEQIKFQTFFPHYFEKQCTDGVDHTIYIGPPLVKNKAFHPIYLENIRIWQMMVICGAAYVADNLRASLPVPLDLTHLIVVQETPLSIRFSHDEKQFEVDGAYNIRYEIMKKRIDKATIKGSDERLTQPGKLAIVYSQKKERHEYAKYIEYLQAEGYFHKEIEDLEIGDLQGIHGLKAMRVGINIKNMPHDESSKASNNLSNVVAHSKRWLMRKRKEMEETAQKTLSKHTKKS